MGFCFSRRPCLKKYRWSPSWPPTHASCMTLLVCATTRSRDKGKAIQRLPPPGDPSHIQPPNPDVMWMPGSACWWEPDKAVSWEVLPEPDKDRGRSLQLTIGLTLGPCLSQGFYSCINIMSKKQVGEERVYSAYISTLLFITKGSQD